jgi:hypothetical protein
MVDGPSDVSEAALRRKRGLADVGTVDEQALKAQLSLICAP